MSEAVRQRIGAAIRGERIRNGWSAAELARRSGVSKASVSQLESGAGNPSVETLWSLSDALGVPFSKLVDPGYAGPTVIRAKDAQPITAEGSVYSASLLSACPSGARRDIYLVRAEPGTPRRSTAHQTGTTEHVILVTGAADVGPPEDPQRLGPGDYASYRGDSDHIFTAHASGTVAILISELR